MMYSGDHSVCFLSNRCAAWIWASESHPPSYRMFLSSCDRTRLFIQYLPRPDECWGDPGEWTWERSMCRAIHNYMPILNCTYHDTWVFESGLSSSALTGWSRWFLVSRFLIFRRVESLQMHSIHSSYKAKDMPHSLWTVYRQCKLFPFTTLKAV